MSYVDAFIRVAPDCPAAAAEPPPARPRPSVAELQHALLAGQPYELTQDDLYVRVHGLRKGLSPDEIEARHAELHAEVFARPQACLRASPLAKRYGFGFHYDGAGRIALVPRGGDDYDRLAADPSLQQLEAMRSSRA
ncbi:MAG TPA: DUF6157 family protein [Solirubrobacteraceae bacterium]|nr:DUF6157 family protein [Solirubrobacteraceae bacterium]